MVSQHSSKKAKRRASKAQKTAKRAKFLPASTLELNAMETSTLRSLNVSNGTASTLFSESIESIPSTIHESDQNFGSTNSMNQMVVSYHNWN